MSGNCWAVNNSNGQVVVTGNVTGGSSTAASGFPSGIYNDTGTVTVTGSVSAGAIASSHGILNNSTGTITVVGDVIATNGANGINSTNTSSVVRASGSFTYGANGTMPIMASRFFLNSTPLNSRTRYALNGTSTYFDMYGADNNAAGGVATSDVRAGVTYAGLTGTCAVPPAASVAIGVPVDNTTGTALLTGAAVASAVWGAATRTLTAGAGITAADVWSHASRTVTGGTVDTLTNAPTVPTAAAIATQVWAVADKTGYSLTIAERTAIAAAVESSILNEGDGQAILNAIVTAIGNTNISQVALVSAIRADMERNGGNLSAIKSKTDALPASPAATGDIPTESEIAAEVWAKPTTELTITGSIGERAKNQSTVSTTGAQLAAALS